RHPLEESAKLLEFEAVCGVLDRPGAKKQQPLEDRVIEDVEQTRGETDDRKDGHSLGQPKYAQPDANEDDPDILDAMISEKTLQIVLGEGEQHPEHAARHAGGNQQPT